MPKVKSLEELTADIEKKAQEVASKKLAYEKAVKEHKDLCDKRNAMMLKEINEAMGSSTKTLDDVLEFLRANQK